MGLFDLFKPKPKESDESQRIMQEMAKKMFPNGYSDVERGGKDIAGILSGKLSEEKCRELFASVKSVMLIAKDKSKARILQSIMMRGDGNITENEASLIYRYLIDADPVKRSAQ